VTVELARPAPCAGCAGACFWYRLPRSELLTLAARNPFPVGAAVTVTLPALHVLAGAAFVYGLPLVALLAGAAVAAATFASDFAAAAGAAAGLGAAVLVAGPLRRRLERATLRRLAVRLAG
jgi:positive regulator of sigma E activity